MSTDEPAPGDWADISYIRRHQARTRIVTQLHEQGPQMPSTLADATDIDIASISHSIGQLRDRDVVKLLVPEDTKKGRIYGLTEHGERLANHVTEVAQ